jgi:hypothetical protein
MSWSMMNSTGRSTRTRPKAGRAFRHCLRWGRYRGRRKTELQAIFTATMVNTKRLTVLATTGPERGQRIYQALAA